MKLKALTIFLLCGFSINASSSSHPQKSDKNTILSIPELRSFSHQTTMTFLKERKEIALFHCLRINYQKVGYDIFDHDISKLSDRYIKYFNNANSIQSHDMELIDFVSQETSKYYQNTIDYKSEVRSPPFTQIFADCMSFYLSSKLEKFIRAHPIYPQCYDKNSCVKR